MAGDPDGEGAPDVADGRLAADAVDVDVCVGVARGRVGSAREVHPASTTARAQIRTRSGIACDPSMVGRQAAASAAGAGFAAMGRMT